MENVHNFLKRMLTKILDNSGQEWDDPFACYCYNIFPSSSGIESPFFLMFGQDPAEGCLSHFNNNNRYYGTNEGKIVLGEHHKLWKHLAKHLKEMHQRNEHKDQQINKKNPTFEIGQPVMVKNYAYHTFETKYILDYRVLKILHDSTLLVVTSNVKERNVDVNDVKLYSTTTICLGFIPGLHKNQVSKF